MWLRDFWLETVATCVTAGMLVFLYTVLAGYAAGPAAGTYQASVVATPAPQQRLADSVTR
ncbi:MAG TPA: hypothetical protein VGG01_08820 [Xanthobacteraceae bacterium]|jgi:hypothetical protein